MPKKVLQVANFSGGLNAYADARDIKDSEFVQNWDAVVDRDGIIRTSGMATDFIYADMLNNDAYQSYGYGLFQFTSDYSFSYGMDGSFSTGFKQGSIGDYEETGAPSIDLEAGVPAQDADYWKDWIIYISNGPGQGASRLITASSTASPPVLDFAGNIGTNPTSSSTYNIFRWAPSSEWLGDGSNSYDWIKEEETTTTTRAQSSHLKNTSGFIRTQAGNRYIQNKCAAVSNGAASYLGNIEFNKGRSLQFFRGAEYGFSFEYWIEEAADGNDENKYSLYSSDAPVGDKPPFFTLESPTWRTAPEGAIKAFDDVTPTNGEIADSVSASGWNNDTTYYDLSSTSSLAGHGCRMMATTDGSGNPHFYFAYDGFNKSSPHEARGEGYVVDEVLTFTNSDGGTAELVVNSINPTGISLRTNYSGDSDDMNNPPTIGAMKTANEYALGIAGNGASTQWTAAVDEPEKNYQNLIVNGDFEDGSITGWTSVNANSAPAHAISQPGVGYTPTNKAGGLKIVTTGMYNELYGAGVYQDVTVKTGEWYTLSLLVGFDLDDADGSGHQFAGATIGSMNYDMNLLPSGFSLPTHPSSYRLGNVIMVENTTSEISAWPNHSTTIHSSKKISLNDTTQNIRYVWKQATFHVPLGVTSTWGDTQNDAVIRIALSHYFEPASGTVFDDRTLTSYYHGVTLTKALPGVIGEALYQPLQFSPYKYDSLNTPRFYDWIIKAPNFGLSTYGTSPPSDFSLKLHAGHYAFESGTGYGSQIIPASLTQNFDNISLVGVTDSAFFDDQQSETLTLMTSEETGGTSIALNTGYNQNYWDKSFLSWPQINAKPVYNWINGMLKISDGNFSNTTNNNKLVFYLDRVFSDGAVINGWRKREQALGTPPEITIIEFNDEIYATNTFNAVEHFNTYFEGRTYRDADSLGIAPVDTTEDTAADGTATYHTNWALNCFGDTHHHGMVIRYFSDKTSQVPNTGMRYGESNDFYNTINQDAEATMSGPAQLYDVSTQWYEDHINPETKLSNNAIVDQYGDVGIDGENGLLDGASNPIDTSLTSDSVQLTRLGINPASSDATYNSSGVYVTPLENSLNIDTVADWPTKEIPHNPVCLVLEKEYLTDFRDANNAGDVAWVEVEVRYESIITTWDGWLDTSVPVFYCQAGKPELAEDIGIEYKEAQILGGDIPWLSPSASLQTNFIGYGVQSLGWSQYGLWTQLGIEGIDSYDELSGISANVSFRGLHKEDCRDKAQFSITWKSVLSFAQGAITSEDDLLIKIKESLFSHYTSDGNPHANFDGYPITGGMGGNSGNTGGEADDKSGYHFKSIDEHGTSNIMDTLQDIEMNADFEGKVPASWQTFKIKKLNIGFYHKETLAPSAWSGAMGGNDILVAFNWGVPTGAGTASWGERTYRLATTVVNVFGEESGLSGEGEEIGFGVDGKSNIAVGHSPEITIQMKTGSSDEYITRYNFYMKDTESDIWYLQFYINTENMKAYSTTSGISVNAGGLEGLNQWILDRDNFKSYNEVNSYESETMVSQEDAKGGNSKLTCKYQTSVVAANRLYVGNIFQNGKHYGDRMLKSPVNKYNIFPASNFIDVAINDGDAITGLAYYKDKILQFKNRKVFVINISGDYEFLEDTFDNIGVVKQACITTTPHGICWVNKQGFYLYDGTKVDNLIDRKIPTQGFEGIGNNYWIPSKTDVDLIPIVGYSKEKDTAIIKFSEASQAISYPEGATYHFGTKSWVFLTQGAFAGNTDNSNSGAISNMITNSEGDVLFYRFQSGENASTATTAYNSIKKYTVESTNNSTDGDGSKIFTFTTKDFTFGDIAARKKIYKVYVTYKTTESGTPDSGVTVLGAINGTQTFDVAFSASTSKFAGTTTACYAGSTLDDTTGIWKTAELRFSTPSDVNNVYSFQLRFFATDVDVGFEINDLSIVYRAKNLK